MKIRQSQTHYSHHHGNQDEGESPVTMVPAVGLKTKDDKPFSFPFKVCVGWCDVTDYLFSPHMQPLLTTSVVTMTTISDAVASTTKSATVAMATQSPAVAMTTPSLPNFSFSTPKPVAQTETASQTSQVQYCLYPLFVPTI